MSTEKLRFSASACLIAKSFHFVSSLGEWVTRLAGEYLNLSWERMCVGRKMFCVWVLETPVNKAQVCELAGVCVCVCVGYSRYLCGCLFGVSIHVLWRVVCLGYFLKGICTYWLVDIHTHVLVCVYVH